MRAVLPEPLRDHYVVVGGRRFPPKQVIALVTGLDRADFTTNQARGVLRRLGFATGRAHVAAAPQEPSIGQTWTEDELRYAAELRPHRGRFVAVKDQSVMVAAADPTEIVRWLERHDQYADSLFRVPLDPSVDMGGFPG